MSLLGHRPAAPGPQDKGFTLVELMVTLVITVVLIAIAVPSMREFIARKRVEGVANELVTDLRYLRAMQIERGVRLGIRFNSNDDNTCYVLFVAAAGGRVDDCDCIERSCGDGAQELKTVVLNRNSGVAVTADRARLYLSGTGGLPDTRFNGQNVLLNASVGSSLGGVVRVSTNATARPSICSVSGHEGALPSCPSP